MKILVHVLETQNQFGRDRVAEGETKKLAVQIAKGLVSYTTKIQKIDYYDDVQKNIFKAELLKQDKEIFHVIIPGGQCAQEALYVMLDDKELINAFIVYNSNWDMLHQKEIQFGKIAKDRHYNLAQEAPNQTTGIEPQIDLADNMVLLFSQLAREAFKDYPVQASTFKTADDRYSTLEKRSQQDAFINQTWNRAAEVLPENILQAIVDYSHSVNNSNTSSSSFKVTS